MPTPAYIRRIDFDNALGTIDVHLQLMPARGPEAIAIIDALQQWMIKGTADLEFEDPPAASGAQNS